MVQAISLETTLNAWRQAQFDWTDTLRRAQGDAFGAWGLGPHECRYRIIAAGSHWRLREYIEHDGAPAVLIVAAPIKRPYIWDLAPSASTIRHCLRQRLRVHLLEWLPAPRRGANNGLEQYTQAIGECVATIADAADHEPFLFGHSLGGTLAAIFAAAAPDRLRGLVLLGAPLCFEPRQSRFRDALVALVPATVPEAEPFPGSLLSQLSALAAPATFVWSRFVDAALSVADQHALDIHARVERWALDEVPLPGRLVRQIVEWLYRDNRFCRGTLPLGAATLGPGDLATPTLAVVNTADEVAPLSSVKGFIDAMPAGTAEIMQYPGEMGACLQHLAILVGRQAHARIWPQIFAWMRERR